MPRKSVTESWMKARQAILSLLAVVGIVLFAARPFLAHHSRAMFDVAKNVTYTGVVEKYLWQNPHSHIVVKVDPGAKDLATIGTWDIEASSINLMVSEGWTPTTFKPGDPITVVAHPMRNGFKGALLFYAFKPDGTRLYRAQHRYPSETE